MDNSLITKNVINAGTKSAIFTDGSKVIFHFQTKTCGDEPRLLDDSRTFKKPMELILGKKFKLEVWEAIVQTMAINEVSSFVVDKKLVHNYPLISKALREAGKPVEERKSHCCGATLHSEGMGYEDLTALFRNPVNLEFIIELLKVESPEEFEKETWLMDDDEKLKAVPQLKEEGNQLYKDKEHAKAAEKYALALGMLEQLMIKEKPGESDWVNLNNTKIPILLNFAQCKLLQQEYYVVIEHCSTVLESDQKNVKALYRRGKAHAGVWNLQEAESDFKKAAELDPTLTKLVNKELKDIEVKRKQKDSEFRARLVGRFF